MDSNLNYAATQLTKGELLRIRDGQGKSVAVFRGLAWITQDNDSRDQVLAAGESLMLDRPGLAIVQALANAAVLVLDAAPNDYAVPQGDAAAPQAYPMTAQELHQEARRLRSRAIGEALHGVAGAARRKAQQAADRVWLRLSGVAH